MQFEQNLQYKFAVVDGNEIGRWLPLINNLP